MKWMRENIGVVVLCAIVSLVSATVVAVATQTNYLGTVFIADTTTPTNQLKVNSDGSINVDTSGGGGTQNVNVNQWGGSSLGAPSAYGTPPGAVSVPGVNAYVTNSPATNQTTPGTTDLVTQRYQRQMVVKGSFVPASSYSVANNAGGLLTISTGLASGTMVNLRSVRSVITAAAIVTAPTLEYLFFNASPTTTFTDGSTSTISSSDATKIITGLGNSSSTLAAGISGAVVYNIGFPTNTVTTVDTSGNIYLAIMIGIAPSWTTPSEWAYQVEVDY